MIDVHVRLTTTRSLPEGDSCPGVDEEGDGIDGAPSTEELRIACLGPDDGGSTSMVGTGGCLGLDQGLLR